MRTGASRKRCKGIRRRISKAGQQSRAAWQKTAAQRATPPVCGAQSCLIDLSNQQLSSEAAGIVGKVLGPPPARHCRPSTPAARLARDAKQATAAPKLRLQPAELQVQVLDPRHMRQAGTDATPPVDCTLAQADTHCVWHMLQYWAVQRPAASAGLQGPSSSVESSSTRLLSLHLRCCLLCCHLRCRSSGLPGSS